MSVAENAESEIRHSIGYPELCYRCDGVVAWAKSRSGKKILMDFYPSYLGRFIIDYAGSTESVVGRIAPNAMVEPDVDRFTCHYDTCPKARRPKGTTPRGKGLTGPARSA